MVAKKKRECFHYDMDSACHPYYKDDAYHNDCKGTAKCNDCGLTKDCPCLCHGELTGEERYKIRKLIDAIR